MEPLDVARRHPLGRGVQQEGARVAEERGGEGEPAVHAGRERTQAVLGDRRQAGLLQEFVRPLGGHPGDGGEHPQVTPGPAAGVARRRAIGGQQDADLALRPAEAAIGPAVEERDALAAFESEHQPQCGGLARLLGAEQRGHHTGPDVEGEVEQGRGPAPAVDLGQSGDLDHRWLLPCPRPTGSARHGSPPHVPAPAP